MIHVPSTQNYSAALDAILNLPFVRDIKLPHLYVSATQYHDDNSTYKRTGEISIGYEFGQYTGTNNTGDVTYVNFNSGNLFGSVAAFDSNRNEFSGGNSANGDISSNWNNGGYGYNGDAYLNIWRADPWGGASNVLSAEVHIDNSGVNGSGTYDSPNFDTEWNYGSGKNSFDWHVQTPKGSATFDSDGAFSNSHDSWTANGVMHYSDESTGSNHSMYFVSGDPAFKAYGLPMDVPWWGDKGAALPYIAPETAPIVHEAMIDYDNLVAADDAPGIAPATVEEQPVTYHNAQGVCGAD